MAPPFVFRLNSADAFELRGFLQKAKFRWRLDARGCEKRALAGLAAESRRFSEKGLLLPTLGAMKTACREKAGAALVGRSCEAPLCVSERRILFKGPENPEAGALQGTARVQRVFLDSSEATSEIHSIELPPQVSPHQWLCSPAHVPLPVWRGVRQTRPS